MQLPQQAVMQLLVRLVDVTASFCFSHRLSHFLWRHWHAGGFKALEDVSPGCGFSGEHQCSREDNGGRGKQEVEKEEKAEDRWEDTRGLRQKANYLFGKREINQHTMSTHLHL